MAAWYRHWQGLAHTLNKDIDAATPAYVLAANVRTELGRPSLKGGMVAPEHDISPGPQAKRLHKMFSQKKSALLKKLPEVKEALKYGPDSNSTEQALRDLRMLLGLEASRPEKEHGTGPDVLWRYPENKAGVALEAKTNKKTTTQYQKKDDIGQFHDHVEWLQGKWPDEIFYKAIVGRKLTVSKDANPPPDLKIITLEQFVGLVDRLQALVEFVDSVAQTTDLEVCIERALRYYGLKWPSCIESLESFLAMDLKQSEAAEATSYAD